MVSSRCEGGSTGKRRARGEGKGRVTERALTLISLSAPHDASSPEAGLKSMDSTGSGHGFDKSSSCCKTKQRVDGWLGECWDCWEGPGRG